MSYGRYLEQALLDVSFSGGTFPSPTLYVALFTNMPDFTGAGGTEVSGGGYARQTITFDNATGVTPAITQNSAQVNFPAATQDWGTIQGVALYDANTGGNMLLKAPLNTPRIVATNDIFSIPAGNFDISLD